MKKINHIMNKIFAIYAKNNLVLLENIEVLLIIFVI